MEHLLEGLTAAQREAVLHLDGPLLVLAGPGSGKTRVITHRIAHLLARRVPPENILALTFTNKAADEMIARIDRLAPERPVWVGTFHRFCARLLRKYAPLAGLQENYTIYDTGDSRRAIRRVIETCSMDTARFTNDAISSAISWAKNNLVTPDQYQPRPGHALGNVVREVYPAYQAQLASSNAADFDDLLMHVAGILRENPELRRTLDRRYQYVLVDEYQDTNLAQYAIVRALSIDYPNLAVTGDPDQSIYGWRGANLKNILEFEKDFPNVRVVRLQQNYRSTRRILRIAAMLITHNIKRKEKDLYTENSEGLPVRLVRYEDEQKEAHAIAGRIADEIHSGRRRPRDFAVFYRINALSLPFELAFREHGIPFQMVRGLEFFQRREIKDVLAYLQLLANPQNDLALLRVINTPARGIGKTTIRRLSDHAARHGLTLLEAARRCRDIQSLPKRSARRVAKFVEIFDGITAVAADPVEEILGHVLVESGYKEQLKHSENKEDQERLANVEELLTVGRQFDERCPGGECLEEFLEETSLVNDTDDWETERDRVTLMTLHASKGLEFPVIFMVAVEEGLLPHERSRDRLDELEEERRLMFVGITRSQQELQFSLARYRDFRGQRKMPVPSSFLAELPRGEMSLEGFGTATPARPKPIDGAPIPAAPRVPAGVRLTTAAELAGDTAELPVLSPAEFHQGMTVLHPQYGLGQIIALSGTGPERTATIDFSSHHGRQKILLRTTPLQPMKR